ncbi:DUF805 domain-containing protein [Caulobacter hibisci]|uniref:DUF805 domain-containing protein n=1 Tax=Caulobacter hibisci TaxID=2035993 RepID=A0ABS0T250_9CAUL|nr:DUF805 domain-containing protein [Caulobacter hibisci]MBI1685968.1 DUF805 domain-containing protein [Caulobacter hibisci]
MQGLVGKLKPFFAVSGRATRLTYWRMQLAMALASAILMCLVVAATRIGGWLGAVPCLLFLPVAAAGICVAVRRLHDRGKAAGWILVFGLGPYSLTALAGWAYEDGGVIVGLPLALAALVLSGWAWIELGFLRGTRGENRYGAEPKRL